MKKIFLVFFILVLSQSVLSGKFVISTNSVYNENLRYLLKGNVKKLTVIDHSAVLYKESRPVSGSKTVREYDRDHNLLSDSVLFLDGTLWMKMIYGYDEAARTIKASSYSFDGTLNNISISVFDNNNNMILTMMQFPDRKIVTNCEYRYDPKGTRMLSYHSREQTAEYHYTEQGRLKDISFKDAGNGPKGIILYYYDDKGRKTEEISKDKNGHILWSNKYIFDEKGNNIENRRYDVSLPHKKEKSIMKYNEKNRMTENRRIIDGQPQPKNTFDYDDNGNLIQTKSYDKNDKVLYSSKRVFDPNNNLVKQSLFDARGKEYETTVYTYDETGNILSLDRTSTLTNQNQKYSLEYQYEYWP